MPSYAGGKAKLGENIAEEILKLEKAFFGDNKRRIIIPFAGFLGVSIHLAKKGRKIKANDINSDIIAMWTSLKKGWTLPKKPMSKVKYENFKEGIGSPKERGFFGVACAYSGIPFAGYRAYSKNINYFKRTRKGLEEMTPYLDQFSFTSKSYDKIKVGCGNLIYCDPPYKNNKFRCRYFVDFDHNKFWNTMRKWSRDGNLVIISEYEAPDDFICVWSKTTRTVFGGKIKIIIEKLFVML